MVVVTVQWMNLRAYPSQFPHKSYNWLPQRSLLPTPPPQTKQMRSTKRVKTSWTILPRIAKRYNVQQSGFFFIWSKMFTEKEVRVQLLSAFFFIAALTYQDVEGIKENIHRCILFLHLFLFFYFFVFPSAEYQNWNMQFHPYYSWSVCVWKGFLWEFFQWRAGCESFRFQKPRNKQL